MWMSRKFFALDDTEITEKFIEQNEKYKFFEDDDIGNIRSEYVNVFKFIKFTIKFAEEKDIDDVTLSEYSYKILVCFFKPA